MMAPSGLSVGKHPLIEELILHVGAPKTGTTAVQWSLTRQREELLARGIYFPAAGLLGDVGVPVNLQDLAGYAADADRLIGLRVRRGLIGEAALQPYRQRVKEGFAALIDAVERSGASRLLFSAEGLFDHLRRPEELQRLADLVTPVAQKLRILLWLRRQDQYLLSRVSQAAKGGTATVAERCRVDEDYDYAARLARWRHAFPGASFTVLPYRSDTLPDFCRAVGLSEDFLKEAPQPVNTSLTPWAIAAMAAMETRVPLQLPDGRRNPRRDRVMAKVRELARDQPTDRLALSQVARRRLLLTFEAGNRQLADLYNRGQPLFDLSDLGPREEWGELAPVSEGESLLDALNLPSVEARTLASLVRNRAVPDTVARQEAACRRLIVLHALKLSGTNPFLAWLEPQLDGTLIRNFIPVSPILRARSSVPKPVDLMRWLARRNPEGVRVEGSPLLVGLDDHDLGVRPFSGVVVPFRPIVLLRHPTGLFADRARKAFSVDDPAYPRNAGPLLQRVLRLWVQHAREYLGQTRMLPGRLAVYFDRWHGDADYRRAVSDALELGFDDRAFARLAEGWTERLSGRPGAGDVSSWVASLQAPARELLEQVWADPELQDLTSALAAADPYACLNG